MIIIPSILIQTETEFRQQVEVVQGMLNFLQLDIADGKFVPNVTWADPKVVAEYDEINFELHLMVSDPLKEIKKWTEVKNIKRVLIHIESPLNVEEAIIFAKKNNWQVGLVLNPNTSLNFLNKYLSQIDAVMFMGGMPGKQGQTLMPEVLEKIKEFTSLHPKIFTELDIGVNETTLPNIYASGMQAVCPGSAIFKNDRTPKENVERMREIINRLTNSDS